MSIFAIASGLVPDEDDHVTSHTGCDATKRLYIREDASHADLLCCVGACTRR